MAIDILQTLQETGDGFRAAVITTYSLNLNFFEQLIAPRLDAIGCTNVLILTDVHGYDDGLTQGARTLNGVGVRYVCAPLLNPGRGIQHAKLILLAGPCRGRLLVGSGNLTLHGYGRNLELFTRFDVTVSPDQAPPIAEMYPFSVAWQLLQQLQRAGALSATASDRLAAIEEAAPCLSHPAVAPTDLRLWHNLDQPLLTRLAEHGPLNELHVIAPFFDLATIEALAKRLQPRRLVLGLDPLNPNLNGATLAARCRAWGCELALRTLDGRDGQRRPLHAKAIIGLGPHGAWCVSGSANCTGPALLGTWANGGNLELAVWRRSPDPAAFQAIWADELVTVQDRDPAAVQVADEECFDARPAASLRLVELSYRPDCLSGQFVLAADGAASAPDRPERSERFIADRRWSLELLRLRETIPIEPDREGRFKTTWHGSLPGAEAGRIVAWSDSTRQDRSPYHWIDQPVELARYGHRTYHVRVKGSLQTFDGAGKLFEELLNFLWERVNPAAIQQARDGEVRQIHRRFRGRRREAGEEGHAEPPPALEAFITDEDLTQAITWYVDSYVPHERSTLSLRDLLSLALLRLTAETEPSSTAGEAGERDEDADAAREAERDRQRQDMLSRLRDYLLRYCRRYAQRLTEHGFVGNAGLALLFENHYTLGRVLLEFADKIALFTTDDLRQCVLLIVGGLFWPEGTGSASAGAWDMLVEGGYDTTTLQDQWNVSGLPTLITVLIVEAWGAPPDWRKGLYDEPLVQRSMLAQALLNQIEQRVGQRYWQALAAESLETQALWGFRRAADLMSDPGQAYPLAEITSQLDRLANYRPPVEEKYADLFTWWALKQNHQEQTPHATRLVSRLQQAGYAAELNLLQSLPPDGQVKAVEGRAEYCPQCYLQLPIQIIRTLHRGQLALCPNCRRAVLYWKPKLLT